ncbi:hypothetical protein ACFQRL_00655 [Microbacterium fluvii]|uniref:Chromosome partition protein Smc n=1 Tax=Microbacterium fluvii TaxID=415215 RepID=A0ABW2H9F1_9MICO|nr:hypothetical protein [Microbacterium fluvii]MCU4671096.1 hypothetical protein [Microbacterium fluvii]
MRSPEGNHELRWLEGTPGSIWQRGDDWVKLGTTMDSTADDLTAIADSDACKSKGTDKLAELAGETAGDLKKAATRYVDTGRELRTYADALDTAQTWLSRNLASVEAAERDYQSALDAKDDAVSAKSSLDHQWPWEDDPTPAETAAAADAVSDATARVGTAKTHRDAMWTEFDQVFEAWEEAYDDAVGGIQKAMDTAGNNDGFWEFVDDALFVISVVLVVLSVVALIIGAPLVGLLGLAILALTVVSIGLTLLKFAYGRATLSDVAWSLVALIPFGVGKLLSRGAPILSNVVSGGRSVVTGAIRSGLPRLSLLRPTSWFTPVRSLFAPLTSRLALRSPSMFVNPARSISLGSSDLVQVENFLRTMTQSKWAANPAVAEFVATTTKAMPGTAAQNIFRTVWLGSTATDFGGLIDVLPDIPGLKDVTL